MTLSPNALKIFTLAELLTIKTAILARITAGMDTISLSVAGKSRGQASAINVVDALNAVARELQRRDPTTYGTLVTRSQIKIQSIES